MKSKRFKAGISRMKIPDESSGAADSANVVVVECYHKDWHKEEAGGYYPERALLGG